MKNKKYYILYKIIKDEQNDIIDFDYVYEFTSYKDIRSYINCTNRDIKKMINKTIDKNIINLHKNYCLTLEE